MKVRVDLSAFNLDEMYSQAQKNNYHSSFKDLLIELGANPNSLGISIYDIIIMTPDQAKESFVHEFMSDSPDKELIQNILEHSVIDINATHTIKNAGHRIWNSYDYADFKGTLLDIAYHYKQWDIVHKILQHKNCIPKLSNIDKIFNDCEVPEDIEKYLLNYVSPNTVMRVLLNRIMSEEKFMIFVQRPDIDINKKNKYGYTALMSASLNGHTEIVRMLLEKPEIKVDIKDKKGYTALMNASENGHTEIVRMLLQRPKIKVNLQNEYGSTALMRASRNGHTEIVNLIKSHPNFKKT